MDGMFHNSGVCRCDDCIAAERCVDRAVSNSPPQCPDLDQGQPHPDEANLRLKGGGINPKDLQAQRENKVQLGLLPPAAKEHTARVHELGARKYGRYNWRQYPVKLSVYLDAAERHIDAIRRGQPIDPESGEPHAAHAAACMNIIMDAEACGNLIDDLDTAPTVC